MIIVQSISKIAQANLGSFGFYLFPLSKASPWTTRLLRPLYGALFFQVEKVLTGYPAHYGGLQPHDFLVSVQGQDVFDFPHKKTADLIKSAGTTMHITIER